jgi:hypothetical protein
VTIPQLALDEPLSPELVLVLPPELRAQVLTGLREPVPLVPPPREPEVAAPDDGEPFEQSLGRLLASRMVMLGLIFTALTLVIVALALVARAVR